MAIRQNPRIRPMKPGSLRHERCIGVRAWTRESRRWFRSSSSPLATRRLLPRRHDGGGGGGAAVGHQDPPPMGCDPEGFVNADIRPQSRDTSANRLTATAPTCRQETSSSSSTRAITRPRWIMRKSTLARNIAALGKARLDVKRDRELIAGQFIPQQQLDNDVAAELEARRTSARPAPISPRRSSTTGGRRSPRLFRASQGLPSCRSAVSSARPPS